VLVSLLAGHLATNYIGIRGVVLRSLNRQRAGIAWTAYRINAFDFPKNRVIAKTLTPSEIASHERIFEWPGVLRNGCTDQIMGHCTIGSPYSTVLADHADHAYHSSLLRIFKKERYILCFDARSIPRNGGRSKTLRLHICLQEGYALLDQLKAWVHAEEIGRVWPIECVNHRDAVILLESTYQIVDSHFTGFVKHMRDAGWNLDEGALMTGSPKAVFISADGEFGACLDAEGKKDI